MKKYMMSCLLMVVTISLMAAAPSPDNYVQTKNDKMFFSKISFGPTKAKLILDNGSKITLMNNELIAFKKDGRIYEKLPLYRNDKQTKKEVFMEVLKYTNGMKLYRFTTSSEISNRPRLTLSRDEINKFYVFKNGNYHLQLDERNYQTVLAFFGMKVTVE